MEKPTFDFTLLSPNNSSPGSFAYHLEELKEELTSSQELLVVQTANEWLKQAQQRPIPAQLFSEFWFEGELCILFADTNLGKSILAVELAASLSEGKAIPGFHLQGGPRTVLYLDFELSDKQFETRYSEDYLNHYHFSERFFRAELQGEGIIEQEGSLENQLFACLERALQKIKASVLIVDNITYLRSETEKASHALPLMKELKALKRKYNLSILTLAHTPKRDLSKPITRNDLQGSKMLINFCDSAFAIGESYQDKRVRYLKQIKARNTEVVYDGENVCICQVVKQVNKLSMEKIGYGTERVHLRRPTEQEEDHAVRQIKKLKAAGRSNVEIARALGVSEASIRHWLKKIEE
jgi:DNA-binding CsgD family transcriptional regulator/archaellum biogenesis ATPase FlaH